MLAIHHALLEILSNKEPQSQYVICTDSVSSLQTINQLYPSNPIAQRISDIRYQLEKSNKKVKFVYVPSHTNIEGYDLADESAKEAEASPELQPQNIPICEVLISDMKSRIRNLYVEHWKSSEANKIPFITKALEKPTSPSKRRDQVKICRLRHTYKTNT
ncbi:hypothetical protein HHI36_011092 [Cryptolaemus montrouzieri]|uniref:RNase H type-1 domain-containing protein n=1 Tax=Cryptolaemus montrouzieri TaxID=559131 RepID=A0ABD2MKS5_9CUCU